MLRRLLGQAKGQAASSSATSYSGTHPSNPRRTMSIQVGQGGKPPPSQQQPQQEQQQQQLSSVSAVVEGVGVNSDNNNDNGNNSNTAVDDDDNDNNDTTTAAVPCVLDQGQVAWQQHLQRNRSFVVDLFQGQLCSMVTCNECGSISRTYDPFTSLSLPLATHHDITVTVTVLRHMPRLSTAALAELWYQHVGREEKGRRGKGRGVDRAKGNDKSSENGTGRDRDGGLEKEYQKDLEKDKAAFIEMVMARHIEASKPIRLCVVLPRLAGTVGLHHSYKPMTSPTSPSHDLLILAPPSLHSPHVLLS